MNNIQSNTISMWIATDKILTEHNATWNQLSSFANGAARFRQQLSMVEPSAEEQKRSTKAITKNKNELREAATLLGVQLAANIRAYAYEKKDTILYDEMNYKHSKLSNMDEKQARTTLELIHIKGAGLLDQLNDYEVSKQSLEALNGALKSFVASLGTPRQVLADRVAAGKELEGIVKTGNAELKNLDGLVGNFSKGTPKFVTAYHSARVILDLGIRHNGKGKNDDDKNKKDGEK